jgi:hypothetical protein
MAQQHNPLTSFYRAPKLYAKLPSLGQYYSAEVVEMPENGELPIFAMTAKDELLMKNPDALLNGEAVVQVIKSCVPNVKDASKMLSADIDTLLVAIQGATFGDDLEVTGTCDKCSSEARGIASVEMALETMQVLEEEYEVAHSGLVILVKPFSYSSTIKAGITNFQSTRSLQNLGEIEDDDARLKLFNENFVKVAELNFDLILDSINNISGTNEDGEFVVDDKIQIAEFLNNVDSSVGKAIEEKITEINTIGIAQEMALQCPNPECTENIGIENAEDYYSFTTKVNFDPVNFFTAS